MVEGEQMRVAELLNTLGVGAHGSNIAPELVPGEDDADLHHPIQRASRPWPRPQPARRPRGADRPASDIVVELPARAIRLSVFGTSIETPHD
jgi:hypothetical protein